MPICLAIDGVPGNFAFGTICALFLFIATTPSLQQTVIEEDIMKKFLAIAAATIGICAFGIRADDTADFPCSRSGGAGGPSVQFTFLDTKPFAHLVNHYAYLKGHDFDFGSRATPMFGLTGFHENRCGYRFGGGIWAGYKLFESAKYSGTDSAGAAHDSIAQLRVIPVYAGFLFEKVVYCGQVGFQAGMLLGGGAYVVHASKTDMADPAPLCGDGSDSAESVNHWGAAGFGIMDLYAGATVRLAPCFGIALDGMLGLTYSSEGFGVGYGDFASVNPGVRLRLLVGKL
jgi:hypothetical protein